MKKRLLHLLACGPVLGLLIVLGFSCFSFESGLSVDHWSQWEEDKFKDLITVDNQLVIEHLQGIVGEPPYEPTKSGFDAIRNWVANNISYKLDEEQWGVIEYWQTPEETLSLRTGDCEDYAILLCTLLRAYGIDEEQVYVTIGVDAEGYGHAFLIESWYNDGEWRAIEPQDGTLTFPRRGGRFKDYNLADFTLLRDYEIIMVFNDFHYFDESFPIE